MHIIRAILEGRGHNDHLALGRVREPDGRGPQEATTRLWPH